MLHPFVSKRPQSPSISEPTSISPILIAAFASPFLLAPYPFSLSLVSFTSAALVWHSSIRLFPSILSPSASKLLLSSLTIFY